MRSVGDIIYKSDQCRLLNGDCLKLMDKIPDGYIDLILCDLPYGTTQCKWDTIIPFDALWTAYHRVIKPTGAIVLFGSEPFTSKLICSNVDEFKYNWIWQKNKSTGFLNAKRQPLNDHETISVFYAKQCTYNTQMTVADKIYKRGKVIRDKEQDIQQSDCYGEQKSFFQVDTGMRYPKRIIYADNNHTREQLHPTQKPVELCEYLIKTYTNENEIVLDNCMGSGSAGVAALNTNRRFIGMELDTTYCDIACKRIQNIDKNIA